MGGLYVGSLVIVDSAGVDLADPAAVAAAVGFVPGAGTLLVEVVLAMLSVTAFATLEAYWLAARNNQRLRNRANRCEQCGKQLNPTLEFCH